MSEREPKPLILRGDIVRQKITPTRYDYAEVTCVHGTGALDVRLLSNGETYGWSESMCELVKEPPHV